MATSRNTYGLGIFAVVLATLLMLPIVASAADGGRQIDSGPFSLSLRGGGINDSRAIGLDGRVDYLNQLLNVHLFGTLEILDAGHGEGRVDNNRYGAGIALSKTFARQANLFAGTSFIREMNENFGQAYLGAKLKVTEYALLSASYGFGFQGVKEIQDRLAAESVNWLKAGAVIVDRYGWKANLYYYLTDPGGEKISGIEGEVSYPVLDNLTIGINGSCDLTDKSNLEQNWRTFAFVTYAFGGQKASPIDVALDKNNPVEYPRVIRATVQKNTATSTLAISPTNTTANGCSSQTATFSASGGVAPYTWSTSDSESNLAVFSGGTSAKWFDSADNFCSGGGVVTVTVTDSTGATATATINVTSIPS
jgi:hypothetical protein